MPDRAPPPASLSEQLLLQVLNGLSLIEQRVARTETQNETIIASQTASDESRSRMHQRINEVSNNVASIESDIGSLKELAPIVRMLSDAHVERKTVRRVVREFCRNGYVLTGAVIVPAAGAAWHQWPNIKAVLLRLLGAKIGGG